MKDKEFVILIVFFLCLLLGGCGLIHRETREEVIAKCNKILSNPSLSPKDRFLYEGACLEKLRVIANRGKKKTTYRVKYKTNKNKNGGTINITVD